MIEKGNNWHNIVLKILGVPFFAGLFYLVYQWFTIPSFAKVTITTLLGIMLAFLLLYTAITAIGVLKKKHMIKAIISGMLVLPMLSIVYFIATFAQAWLLQYTAIMAYVDILVLTVLIGIFYYVLNKLLK